jgi:hypothetical protein
VPPVAWNENRIPGVLDALDKLESFCALRAFCFFEARECQVEVVDGLVVLVIFLILFSSSEVLVYVCLWWDQKPPFSSLDAGIPC